MTKDQHIKPTIETIKEFKAHYAKRDFRIEEMRMEKKSELDRGEFLLL